MSTTRASQPKSDDRRSASTDTVSQIESISPIIWTLTALALLYALLAGLHTVQDFDLGWQLASGRWILQHHEIPSQDVFSYTARGQQWIYPALSEVLLYVVYLLGGYSLLSWMGAVTCAGTIALLIRRGSYFACVLGLLAVPLIASRTQPRAEMFTTILFAAFLSLLWQHYRRGHAPLWLLPLLMVAWVNLHLGFVAGLAACCAYVLLELIDLAFSQLRQAARARLGRGWRWLVLTVVATLLNPWGVRVYAALVRQQQAQQQFHSSWVVEWGAIRPSWASLQQAFAWRDPQSAVWWLLAASIMAMGVALWRRQLGAAILLAASAYLALQHNRFLGLFACVAVIVGGSLLTEAWQAIDQRWLRRWDVFAEGSKPRWTLTASLLLLVALLTGVRSWDLVSNRYYLRSAELSVFGPGLSWWYPERSIEFLRREKLPANIFNDYNLGGYLTWRLGPEYPDYIDGRALPFGPQLFFRAYQLSVEPPDSPLWQQEGDARGINTMVVSLARLSGATQFPQLRAFCRSQTWRPVYMDEVSAIFVRRRPETAALIDRLQIECEKLSFAPPENIQSTSSSASGRAKADLFNFYTNAGGVLYALGRYPEALAHLDRANDIFTDNANLHLLRALALQETSRTTEAESEFLTSIRLHPDDETSFDLGLFYMTQKRYAEAAEVFRQSAQSSSRPHDMWMMLGQAYLQMRQPSQALEAFDKAVESSPFREAGESLVAGFNSLVATGRAKAWYQLGDVARAVSFQEEAVKLAPNDPKLWMGLADLYQVQGRITKAEEARSHATRR
jgi:tetratricopeptide (TPR) repeat protein